MLRDLLSRNIFGIERNPDACHVAAFSLYLTMLDYLDRRELTRVMAGESSGEPLPELVGRHLYSSDFFAERSRFKGLPKQVQCILGNPPWQTLDKLNSEAADEWRRKPSPAHPSEKTRRPSCSLEGSS